MILQDYVQPEFYQFSEDSLELVRWIKNKYKMEFQNILDLGAGCGVIGFELSQIYKPKTLSMVEKQNDFLYYINQNKNVFCHVETELNVYHSSFSQFLDTNNLEYDLIVSNPPYYDPKNHLLSPDQNKTQCRFFIQDSYSTLRDIVFKSLAPMGHAFILIKNTELHRYMKEMQKFELFPLTKDVSVLHFMMNVNINK
jgi:tRNA1Val (adenine37-N6)-methyltransferase